MLISQVEHIWDEKQGMIEAENDDHHNYQTPLKEIHDSPIKIAQTKGCALLLSIAPVKSFVVV